jgi:outer membrane immunogenic protein
MLHPLRVFAACAIAATVALWCDHATAGVVIFNPGSGSNSASASSWVAGGHAGYNWQNGSTVFGFETDLQATHLQSSMNGGLMYPFDFPPFPNDFAATSATIDWYGTLRGRVGLAEGPWLFYGTGGLAYGAVALSSSFRTFDLLTSASTSATNAGWVAGVGVEYLVSPNVSFSLGYQYVDLGTLSLSSSDSTFFTVSQTANANARFQTIMAGISWHFAPAPSGPWAGGYVGGNAGGAWGDDANAAYGSSGIIVLSDVRLKHEIAFVGRRPDGLGIYRYKYLWSDTVYVGVMAQEVALVHPDAVVRDPLTGYMSVDYSRLRQPLVVLR